MLRITGGQVFDRANGIRHTSGEDRKGFQGVGQRAGNLARIITHTENRHALARPVCGPFLEETGGTT